ncbi:MAG: acyl-ACP--UDP-N-acetylglucosamine O-acyltransferase [Gammaproteobacteria bacterium]|nr:acyl-ACP--UDP-N-acetylglucosamine O-acyltransferase [Gammaproteobacteria bacterium]MCW8986095.1 acyl-ACP--UDP-N-acetylglucosamine O-acyltransferase [Gammaproteobacteria bacterium]MCW9031809.1 acyl-ACP--UDP-N-acetylglucosamine O-acyltransferase [Gammaproteobacteria bacterium]
MSNSIHPTALVSDKAVLGSGNVIGAYVIIEDGVVLGNHNTLLSGSVLKSGSELGNENTIHEHAVIGGLPQDLGFDSKTASYVKIGNKNTVREFVTIHRASQKNKATTLGNENYLMAQVHLGHDCELGNNVIIAPSSGLGGFVTVEDRAFISGGVMVHQFVHIGSIAMLGGNAKITQDVLPYMMADGNPAHISGLNKVGLRRAGFKVADISAIKKAYQLLFNNESKLEKRLHALSQLDHPTSQHLTAFIHASKRGFHRDKS